MLYVGSTYDLEYQYDQTFYVRGEGGCNNPGPLGQVNLFSNTSTFYADSDGDNFGNPSITFESCNFLEEGYVSSSPDCDHSNASINPYGIEICNGVDDDCDGITDEGCAPPPVNDNRVNAQEVATPFTNYPGCILYSGTVA